MQKNTQPRICVDIDNVISETDSVLRHVISMVTNNRVRLCYEDVNCFEYWRCVDRHGEILTQDEWHVAHKEFSTELHLGSIKPIEGAIDGLHELSRYARLQIVTSRLPSGRASTVAWLERHNVPSHDLHFVHRHKHLAIGSCIAAIEDDYAQAHAFAETPGTTSFLLSHPWNANGQPAPNLHWAPDWPNLTKHLRELLFDRA